MDFFTEVPASLFAFVLVQSNSTEGGKSSKISLGLRDRKETWGLKDSIQKKNSTLT